jgi:ParB-like chromosome segregation protein Spo0J
MAGKLWNRNQVEAVPLTELHLPSRQVRRLVERQITKLAASINRFDFIVPVLATEDGELITGTARAEAARRCGLEIIPVIRITHLSPKEIRAFRIADNRLVELGEWDEEKLAIELKELSALDLDFSLELIHPPKGPVRSRSIYSL